MLRSILYFLGVTLSFSHTLHSLHQLILPRVHAPVKPFTLPSFANLRKEERGGEMSRRHWPFEVFYGFVLRCSRLVFSLPSSSPPVSLSRCVYPRVGQITKNVNAKLIWYLASPSSTFLHEGFLRLRNRPRLRVSVEITRVDFTQKRIGIGGEDCV